VRWSDHRRALLNSGLTGNSSLLEHILGMTTDHGRGSV
jgi:hypothetical protein